MPGSSWYHVRSAGESAAQVHRAYQNVVRKGPTAVPTRIKKQGLVIALTPVQRIVHVPRENQARLIAVDRCREVWIAAITAGCPSSDEGLGRGRVHDPDVRGSPLRAPGAADVQNRRSVQFDALAIGPDVRIADLAQPIGWLPASGLIVPLQIVIAADHAQGMRIVPEPIGYPGDLLAVRRCACKVQHIAGHHPEVVGWGAMEHPVKPTLVEVKIGNVKNGHDRCLGCSLPPFALGEIGPASFELTARNDARWRKFGHAVRRRVATIVLTPGLALKVLPRVARDL